MTNEEQVSVLRQGVERWNAWRAENRTVKLDLTNADFTGANLRGANLRDAGLRRGHLSNADLSVAHLGRADLSEGDLRGANVSRSDLRHAYLRYADFSRANLSDAILADADLSGADLCDAILYGTNLRQANFLATNLSGADLGDAELYDTAFVNVDLTDTKGLGTCHHGGPSAVDHRTLARSRDVPLNFWRGCGLSDLTIEAAKLYQPGLSQSEIIDITDALFRLRGEQPIQFQSCFISHTQRTELDRDFAKKLHDDLQEHGVRCWRAPKDLRIGDRFRDVIDHAIHLHDRLLVILSENSVQSDWVGDEVEAAIEKEQADGGRDTVLFPVTIDYAFDSTDVAWARKIRRTRHIGDFIHWKDRDTYQQSFEQLLRDLRALGNG